MKRGSSAAPSCSTTFTNQYGRPQQRNQRKAEPLNRVGQMRPVVKDGRGPAPRQSGGGIWTLELDDERQKTRDIDVAAPARRDHGHSRHDCRIRLVVQSMIDMECVG